MPMYISAEERVWYRQSTTIPTKETVSADRA